ncbi:MAG: hypothetical protein ABH878_07745 [bacterium]
MAKQQSFADKVAKAQSKQAKKCPVCDGPVSYVKVVNPVQLDSGVHRFSTKVTKICKCNEASVLGG